MIKKAYVKFQINIVVSEKEAPHWNFQVIKEEIIFLKFMQELWKMATDIIW